MKKTGKMRDTLKLTLLITTLFFSLLTSIHNIEAKEIYFDLSLSSNAKVVDTAQSLQSDTKVPYGATIQMTINITNHSGVIDSNITFVEKEGIKFKEYYNGVLKINGRNATKGEYVSYIGTGKNITLNNKKTTYEIEVTSIGSSRNRISMDTKISSNTITVGDKAEIYEHAFSGNFAFDNSMHIVNLYDGATLLQQIKVKNNQSIDIPILSKNGYKFLGFNTQLDGKGSFYSGEKVKKSMNLYAVFTIKQYQISYYVDNQLYHQMFVNHGYDAAFIEAPSKKDNQFIGWSESLTNITEDMVVYALYQKDEVSKSGLSYRIDQIIEGSIYTEYDGKIIPSPEEFNIGFFTNIKLNAEKSFPFKLFISLLPFIIMLLIVLSYLYYRKRKRGVLHES